MHTASHAHGRRGGTEVEGPTLRGGRSHRNPGPGRWWRPKGLLCPRSGHCGTTPKGTTKVLPGDAPGRRPARTNAGCWGGQPSGRLGATWEEPQSRPGSGGWGTEPARVKATRTGRNPWLWSQETLSPLLCHRPCGSTFRLDPRCLRGTNEASDMGLVCLAGKIPFSGRGRGEYAILSCR